MKGAGLVRGRLQESVKYYGDEVLKVFEMTPLFSPPTQNQH